MIDVAIIGAGPVGTLLSAELARHGVEAVLLEQRDSGGAGSRAVGIHATALAAMEGSGATERLLSRALRVHVGEARRDGRSLGLVRFDRLRIRHPYVATLAQPVTESVIAETALAWGASPATRGARVAKLTGSPDRVEIAVEGGSTRTARVAVVAGGLRSRTLLPAAVRERRYPDRYLMTDCADTGPDGDRAVVHLSPDGVLESFPLPGGQRRYVAWAGTYAEHGMSDAERLRRAVATRTGSEDAAAAVSAASSFGIARSRAATLRAGRILAIGDAAHEVSPVGGQGMNLGLIDAVTLAPILQRFLAGDEPGDLDAWSRERRRAADRSGRIAALNTRLGRPGGRAGATAVRAALATPAAAVLARAYAMGFDPAASRFSRASR